MQLQVLAIIILSVSTVLSLLSEKPFLSLQYSPFSSLLGYSPSQEPVCVPHNNSCFIIISLFVICLSHWPVSPMKAGTQAVFAHKIPPAPSAEPGMDWGSVETWRMNEWVQIK